MSAPTQPPSRPIAHSEYAFNPRQGAMSFARYHAVLDQDMARGQFSRRAGDALCKPRRKFWGLSPGASDSVDGPRCLELAARHDVSRTILAPSSAVGPGTPRVSQWPAAAPRTDRNSDRTPGLAT